MSLQVEIEKHSGFCGGVIRAISRAEKFLEEHSGGKLYSLGAIVHNEAELQRLGGKGLVTIDKEELLNIPTPSSETLLIRAHGEPPQTYSLASKLGLTVIDCTCPVVLRLQKSIRQAYERLKPTGGQLIIFGKIGHAEVLGLLGQVDGATLRPCRRHHPDRLSGGDFLPDHKESGGIFPDLQGAFRVASTGSATAKN